MQCSKLVAMLGSQYGMPIVHNTAPLHQPYVCRAQVTPARRPLALHPCDPYRRYSATEIFVCDEESAFYAQSLEKLLPQAHAAGRPNGCVVEFGSGDGAPVVAALQALGDR